jgi:hypothetical protein
VSKDSRRRQRAASQSRPGDHAPQDGAAPAGGDPRPASTSPSGTTRAGRRERARASTTPASFTQRYRTVILGAAVVAVVAIVGAGMLAAATQPAFACSTQWEPTPTPSPGAGTSPQPGYPQPDMGAGHVGNGTFVTYTYCPPASGRHFNSSGTGPITPRLYGPTDNVIPQGWIHNLEHGALVLLYRPDGPGGTPEGQAALREFWNSYPPSPVCGWQPGAVVGPVFAPFEQMAWPFAAMVWGRVLPLQDLDTEAILEFDSIFGENTNPEDFCPDKRVSPSPSTAG